MKIFMFRLITLLCVATIMVGCASASPQPTTAPTVDIQPTLNAVRTQAVQTAVANLTKNAPTVAPATPTLAATLTSTPAATNTLLPPTALPTAVIVYPTLAPTVYYTPTLSTYSCSLTSVTPKATEKIAPSGNFDATWVITNTGSQTWIAKETDLRYSTGTKLHKLTGIVDLSTNVVSGASYTGKVDMVAPATAGTYTTTWIVIYGNITICALNLTVLVAP
jgi:hypothetical protein